MSRKGHRLQMVGIGFIIAMGFYSILTAMDGAAPLGFGAYALLGLLLTAIPVYSEGI